MQTIKYNGLDAQISDYLLTASGHLKNSKTLVDGRHVATFGAAACSALVMMSQAEAAIVMNGGTPVPVTVVGGVGTATFGETSAGGRRFDMDGDGNFDFGIWGYSAGASGSSSSGPGNIGMAPAVLGNAIVGTGDGNDIMKLAAGANIGASASWTGTSDPMTTSNDIAFSVGNGAGNWSGGVGEFGFIGVKFAIASGTHYGWICMKSDPRVPSTISVLAYAYQSTPDTAIQAGDTGNGVVNCNADILSPPVEVPAIGPLVYGLSALALGGLGLGGLRRRRNEQSGKSH